MNFNRHKSKSFSGVRKTSFLSLIYLFYLIPCSLFYNSSFAQQHPDKKRINRLKKELPFMKGNSRLDSLNSLSEVYWWFPRPNADSIYYYANEAYAGSLQNNYFPGLTRSTLNLGVSEIYRRNYPAAAKYLGQSILMSSKISDSKSRGWSYIYLGWVLFLKNIILILKIYKSNSRFENRGR
jgi:hypothetical protein